LDPVEKPLVVAVRKSPGEVAVEDLVAELAGLLQEDIRMHNQNLHVAVVAVVVVAAVGADNSVVDYALFFVVAVQQTKIILVGH
jgi:hypothetical protein